MYGAMDPETHQAQLKPLKDSEFKRGQPAISVVKIIISLPSARLGINWC